MRRTNNTLATRDFDFARLINGGNDEDITEWFSDNDLYLTDIIHGENIMSQIDVTLATNNNIYY